MATPGRSSSDQKAKKATTTSSDRLPSLKGKRDLTLGGVKKKVYTPTIPVRRPKTELQQQSHPSQQTTPTQSSSSSSSTKTPKSDKRRERRPKEIITSASVFSMGPAEGNMRGQRSSDGGRSVTFGSFRGGGGGGQIKSEPRSDRYGGMESRSIFSSGDEEDEETSRVLDKKSLFPNSLFPPVQLPLMLEATPTTTTITSKQHPLARRLDDNDENHLNVVIKEEPMDEDEEEIVRPKSVVMTTSVDSSKEMTAAELFTPKEEKTKGQFLFFQLPDCLPIPLSGAPIENRDNNNTSMTTPTQSGSLMDVPEGHIGKLRVHESGKVTLLLGDTVLDVSMATRGGSLQELVSIRTLDQPPSLSVLGHVSHKLHCVPNFTSLGLHGAIESGGES